MLWPAVKKVAQDSVASPKVAREVAINRAGKNSLLDLIPQVSPLPFSRSAL